MKLHLQSYYQDYNYFSVGSSYASGFLRYSLTCSGLSSHENLTLTGFNLFTCLPYTNNNRWFAKCNWHQRYGQTDKDEM